MPAFIFSSVIAVSILMALVVPIYLKANSSQPVNLPIQELDRVEIVAKMPTTKEQEAKFVFECNIISECKKEINIVERSIVQQEKLSAIKKGI